MTSIQNMLQAGSDWLSSQLKMHASRPVVYQRGVREVTVPAVIGRTLMKLDDGFGGVKMEWTDRDFLIQASDLILDGEPIQPQPGDMIRETNGDVTYVYEVMAPGGEPHWRWSDAYHKVKRIHAKQVGIA